MTETTNRMVPGLVDERCVLPVVSGYGQAKGWPSEHLTPIEVADLLRVTVGTVHDMIASGRLPAFRACRTRILIRSVDLAACIEPIDPETYKGK